MILLAANNTGGGVSNFVQLLTLLVVFVIVLALTYWTTKFVGGYQKVANQATNFENIDTYRVSNNKYIQILRVGKKYLVISVCKDSITKLAELEEDEFEALEYKSPEPFKDIFEKAKKLRKPTQEGKEEKNENEQ